MSPSFRAGPQLRAIPPPSFLPTLRNQALLETLLLLGIWMEARWLLAELLGTVSEKQNKTVHLDISVFWYPEILPITM